MTLGDDGLVVLEAIGSKHGLYLLVRTWGDLVDHRPGISHLGRILQITEEVGRNKLLLNPLACIGLHTCLYLVAIVRAVVGALQGDGQLSCLEASKHQHSELAHGEDGLEAALQVGRSHAVALLGDGEGYHL